jgi:hypothetical protein
MKEFTKAGFKKVRTVLDKALEKAGKELDITLELGSISFDANKFTCKLTALTGTDVNEHAKKEWDKNCVMFGFKPSHFGVSHKPKFGHDTYTIVGINPRARKNPITVTVVGKGDSKWVVPCDRFRDLVGVNTDFF